MKKMIAVIIILATILIGMVIYQKSYKAKNQITVQEINKIQENIEKIYMWEEVTKKALPAFENINHADDLWVWEVVKKNLEEYELSKEQIEEKAKEIFGENFQKEFPEAGNETFQYGETSQKYFATEITLNEQEDTFLLDKIEKTKDGYQVEIIEYIEDYGEAESIKIRNLQGEEIGSSSESEGENKILEIVKNNKERFSKKQITFDKQMYIKNVSE